MGVEFKVVEYDLRIIVVCFIKVDKSKCRDKCWNINGTASNGLVLKSLILQFDQVFFGSRNEMDQKYSML